MAPVSVAFLHGTVKRTNAKELQEAIMSHTVWKGCDIKIVLKSGQLKKSPHEELTRDTAAHGIIVHCAAKDYHQCLQKLSQIYLETVKSGFPLDRKYTVIPDMCSPCFTDHSSDECIPVLETYRASQVTTTKGVHEITLTGVSSLHTELSETHPGVTLNMFIMSLMSLTATDSHLFLSADTNHQDPTKIHLSCLKCFAEEAEAVVARLGILSAERWGEVCWEVWFTPSYKLEQRVAFRRDPTSRAFLSPALDLFVKLAQADLVKAEMELDPNYKREDIDIVLQIVSHMPGAFRTKAAFPHHGASVASSVGGNLDAFSAQASVDSISNVSGSCQDSFGGLSDFNNDDMDAEEEDDPTGQGFNNNPGTPASSGTSRHAGSQSTTRNSGGHRCKSAVCPTPGQCRNRGEMASPQAHHDIHSGPGDDDPGAGGSDEHQCPPPLTHEDTRLMEDFLPAWERIHQSERWELPLDDGSAVLEHALCHLAEIRQGFCSLAEIPAPHEGFQPGDSVCGSSAGHAEEQTLVGLPGSAHAQQHLPSHQIAASPSPRRHVSV